MQRIQQILLAGAITGLTASAPADEPAANTPRRFAQPGQIAVIAVERVLKNYTVVQQAAKQAELDRRLLPSDDPTCRTQSTPSEELARRLPPATPRVTKLDLMRRESATYARAYRDLQRELKQYCEEQGFVLVINLKGSEVDRMLDRGEYCHYWCGTCRMERSGMNTRSNPETMRNKAVYFEATIDFTQPILDRLNAAAAADEKE